MQKPIAGASTIQVVNMSPSPLLLMPIVSTNPAPQPPPIRKPCRHIVKHRRGQPLTRAQKIIVLNVFDSLLEEHTNLAITDIAQLTSDSTGVSVRSVFKARKEREVTGTLITPGQKRSRKEPVLGQCDDFVKNAVRAKVRDLLLDNEAPTTKKVLEAVNSDPELPTFKKSTFFKVLQKIGIRFPKCKKQDGPNSKFWKQQLKNLCEERTSKSTILQETNGDAVSKLANGNQTETKITTRKSLRSSRTIWSENTPQQCGGNSQIIDDKSSRRSIETNGNVVPEDMWCSETNDETNALVDQLQSLIHYLRKGPVAVRSLSNEHHKKVWEIQGPTKNLTVKLHFRSESEASSSDDQDSNEPMIKQEINDDHEFGHVINDQVKANEAFGLPYVAVLGSEAVVSNSSNVSNNQLNDPLGGTAFPNFTYFQCRASEETILPDLNT